MKVNPHWSQGLEGEAPRRRRGKAMKVKAIPPGVVTSLPLGFFPLDSASGRVCTADSRVALLGGSQQERWNWLENEEEELR